MCDVMETKDGAADDQERQLCAATQSSKFFKQIPGTERKARG